LAADVIRSAASATRLAMSHSTRAPQNACMSSVFGVADRIAAFAFTLSVNEYTKDRPDSGVRATSPNVDAASSRSQMSASRRSSAVHSPWT
jgi:hypothetical protein